MIKNQGVEFYQTECYIFMRIMQEIRKEYKVYKGPNRTYKVAYLTILCDVCHQDLVVKESHYKTKKAWGKKEWYHLECYKKHKRQDLYVKNK